MHLSSKVNSSTPDYCQSTMEQLLARTRSWDRTHMQLESLMEEIKAAWDTNKAAARAPCLELMGHPNLPILHHAHLNVCVSFTDPDGPATRLRVAVEQITTINTWAAGVPDLWKHIGSPNLHIEGLDGYIQKNLTMIESSKEPLTDPCEPERASDGVCGRPKGSGLHSTGITGDPEGPTHAKVAERVIVKRFGPTDRTFGTRCHTPHGKGLTVEEHRSEVTKSEGLKPSKRTVIARFKPAGGSTEPLAMRDIVANAAGRTTTQATFTPSSKTENVEVKAGKRIIVARFGPARLIANRDIDTKKLKSALRSTPRVFADPPVGRLAREERNGSPSSNMLEQGVRAISFASTAEMRSFWKEHPPSGVPPRVLSRVHTPTGRSSQQHVSC